MPPASSAWQSARRSARQARVVLVGDAFTAASELVRLGLKQAGLRVGLRAPGDALLSGAHALLDPEAGMVWVRKDAPADQRHIYIAHELAHFHLHEHAGECRCNEADFADSDGFAAVGYGPRQRRETEANVWAREFLLPADAAARLFHGDGLEARAIAARVEAPLGTVYAQLTEALIPPLPEEPKEERAQPTPRPLDPSQAAAAYAAAGPLLVGAGPGTGKTRTLTARVLYLTRERGVPPENLLALTFSRRAAEEMRERIALEDSDIARRAAISTFHSYGLDLLRRQGAALGLPPNPPLLDLTDACSLLERRAGALGLTALRYLHDPGYPLPDILRLIGRAKEDLIGPDAFEQRARATGDDRLADVARVYHAYEAVLREKGALDFADLICRALQLLTENAAVREAEQAQWRHVLVDEYQDVNRAGALLVKALTDGDANAGLWAVGDLRQAIYRFRGASPANVARFDRDFPHGRRTELTVNYRSQPALVHLFGRASRAQFEDAESGDGAETWQAARPETIARPATFALADDDESQADGMARRMHALFAEGLAWGDQTVLLRTRGQARAVRAALTARGVPVAPGPDEGSPFASRDARTLVALLARICEPTGPARHIWPSIPPALTALRARTGGACDAFDLWAEALWGAPGLARQIEDPVAVEALLTLARSFRDRAPILLESGDDPALALLLHLRRMARMGASFGGDSVGTGEEMDAVRVLTVHASKGLEFPAVFVPNLSAGKFPSRPGPALLPALPEDRDSHPESSHPLTPSLVNERGGTGGPHPYHICDANVTALTPSPNSGRGGTGGEVGSELAEEQRLFFVAITRARDYLVLSRALRYGRMSAKESPLLAGIADAPEWEREGWPRTLSDADAPPNLTEEISPTPQPAPAASPGETLTLSAADADLYLRCPRRYYYRKILSLREGAPTPYAGFKRAVTAALTESDPAAALDGHWSTYGPDPAHPHADLYREAAQSIVDGAGRVAFSPAPEFEMPFEHGTLTVSADADVGNGATVEYHTFRKPPGDDIAEIAPERGHSLLLAAAEASGSATPRLQLRYLQSDVVRPIADKPRQRAKHLMEYAGALRGIRLRMFDPAPAEANECPLCPYLFICPD